ncbi:uncharacterized protein LOC129952713 [Eupeodes corollae]|uniref:uncharacterized protein LOC129952713 n=1 Tax=Eupeodes corollae TaxID=290404 RepID=UPI00249227C6|nr:uncharacterized protein LOC129952713 [Eupeodes corollae]
MQKCSNLWNKINRPKSSEEIMAILGSQLKYPVITRWNSLYDSIEDVIKHKSKINDLCKKFGTQNIFDVDFEYLEEFLMLMKPVAEALDFLQKEKQMLYGFLLPTLATVRNKFRKIKTSNALKVIPADMIGKFEDALLERFTNHFNLTPEVHDAIVASVLCPSIKLKWITALNPDFREMKIVEISSLVRQKINAEVKTATIPEETPEISYFDFSASDAIENGSNCNFTGAGGDEFDSYLAQTSTSFEMLNKYPALKKTFLRYNTALPSSAAVERLFSFAGMLNAPRRGSLSDSNFQKLLILKVNGDFE